MSKKLRPFHTFQYRIHLSNDSSEPLGGSFSTMYRSGALAIRKENYVHSKSTTTAIVRIADFLALCRDCNLQTSLKNIRPSASPNGNHAAEVYINYQSRLKLVIRTPHLKHTFGRRITDLDRRVELDLRGKVPQKSRTMVRRLSWRTDAYYDVLRRTISHLESLWVP